MNIHDQVCSLSLAKKLKELNVEQESLFYWFDHEPIRYLFCKHYEQYSPHVDLDIKDGYSAFTVAELMDLLPAFVNTEKNEPFNFFNFGLMKKTAINIRYIANYHCDTIQFNPESEFFNLKLIDKNIYDDKLADCLAKLLIHLIENNYVKP